MKESKCHKLFSELVRRTWLWKG